MAWVAAAALLALRQHMSYQKMMIDRDVLPVNLLSRNMPADALDVLQNWVGLMSNRYTSIGKFTNRVSEYSSAYYIIIGN